MFNLRQHNGGKRICIVGYVKGYYLYLAFFRILDLNAKNLAVNRNGRRVTLFGQSDFVYFYGLTSDITAENRLYTLKIIRYAVLYNVLLWRIVLLDGVKAAR